MYFTKKRERERKKRKGKFAIIIILTFELAFPRFQSRNKDEKVSRPERAMSGINGSCGKLYIHNRCKEVFWPCLTSTFNYVIKYTGYVHRIYESLNRLIIASILLSLSVLLFYLAILDRNLHHLFQKNGTRCWTKSLIIHELYRYLVDSVCSSKKRERETETRSKRKKKGEKLEGNGKGGGTSRGSPKRRETMSMAGWPWKPTTNRKFSSLSLSTARQPSSTLPLSGSKSIIRDYTSRATSIFLLNFLI